MALTPDTTTFRAPPRLCRYYVDGTFFLGAYTMTDGSAGTLCVCTLSLLEALTTLL